MTSCSWDRSFPGKKGRSRWKPTPPGYSRHVFSGSIAAAAAVLALVRAAGVVATARGAVSTTAVVVITGIATRWAATVAVLAWRTSTGLAIPGAEVAGLGTVAGIAVVTIGIGLTELTLTVVLVAGLPLDRALNVHAGTVATRARIILGAVDAVVAAGTIVAGHLHAAAGLHTHSHRTRIVVILAYHIIMDAAPVGTATVIGAHETIVTVGVSRAFRSVRTTSGTRITGVRGAVVVVVAVGVRHATRAHAVAIYALVAGGAVIAVVAGAALIDGFRDADAVDAHALVAIVIQTGAVQRSAGAYAVGAEVAVFFSWRTGVGAWIAVIAHLAFDALGGTFDGNVHFGNGVTTGGV